MKRLAALTLPLLLAACAVGPDYHPAALPPATLAESGAQGATPTALPNRWWQLFADPQLDTLIDKALRHNTDLRIASANLAKARAVLREAQGAQLPDATATAGHKNQRAA